MANPHKFRTESDPPTLSASVPVSRLTGWLGALTSVALAGGLVWWVADLALRDARGVPVVRAMEGPARVAPEDPGGFQAAHQGYAVNRIASEEDVPLADRVMLAPETTTVTVDDQPMTELVPEARDAALRSAVGAALEEVLGGEEPGLLPGTVPGTGPGDVDDTSASGTSRNSPRPAARPELDLVTRASADASVPGLPVSGLVEIEAASIPAGTRLVQLGAYDNADQALAEWARLSGDFEDYMSDKTRVVERTVVSEREFWRLRAYGFASLAEARNFCAVLLAEAADCIPVLTR
jgi:hypothetical protein